MLEHLVVQELDLCQGPSEIHLRHLTGTHTQQLTAFHSKSAVLQA